MQGLKSYIRIAGIISAMTLLILYPDRTRSGALEGIDLCLRTVTPSLFPFFIISIWGNGYLAKLKIPVFHTLSKKLRIPAGCDAILLLGLIGGYPVGAQVIANAWKEKSITKEQALRLLGYCNNAGPAFIFGIAGFLFHAEWIPFLLWCIHIVSALTVGFILRDSSQEKAETIRILPIPFTIAMKQSISITATVCGWIIAFKALLSLLMPILTNDFIRIITNGFLEISGGTLGLSHIQNESIRFILCSAFLAFGGICVLMQTASASGTLGLGLYLPGKIMQMLISILLSLIAANYFLDFHVSIITQTSILLFVILLILVLRKYSIKKMWKLSKT